jgi:hypothetical protein
MAMIWIFIGAMALIGTALGAVIWGMRRLQRRAAEAMTWPATRGRIVEGTVRRATIHLPKAARVDVYHAILVYEYAVGGRTFRADAFTVDGPPVFATHPGAEAHLRSHPPGSAVTVYYDPARPERAALVRQAPRTGFLKFVAALLAVLGLGVFSLFAFTPGIFGPAPWIRF